MYRDSSLHCRGGIRMGVFLWRWQCTLEYETLETRADVPPHCSCSVVLSDTNDRKGLLSGTPAIVSNVCHYSLLLTDPKTQQGFHKHNKGFNIFVLLKGPLMACLNERGRNLQFSRLYSGVKSLY